MNYEDNTLKILRDNLKKLEKKGIKLDYEWYKNHKEEILGINDKKKDFYFPFEDYLTDYKIFLGTAKINCHNIFKPYDKKKFVIYDEDAFKDFYVSNGSNPEDITNGLPEELDFLKISDDDEIKITNKAYQCDGMIILNNQGYGFTSIEKKALKEVEKYNSYDKTKQENGWYHGGYYDKNHRMWYSPIMPSGYKGEYITKDHAHAKIEQIIRQNGQNGRDGPDGTDDDSSSDDENDAQGGGGRETSKTLKLKSKNYNATVNKKYKKRGIRKKIKFIKKKREFTNKLKSKNINKSYKKYKRKSRNVKGGAVKKIRFKKHKTTKLKSKNINSTFKRNN